MISQRSAKRAKFITPTRFGIAVVVLFVVVYGFYVESQDFHPKGGFRQHRKFLRDTSDPDGQQNDAEATVEEHPSIKENIQRESEQLQLASQLDANKRNNSRTERAKDTSLDTANRSKDVKQEGSRDSQEGSLYTTEIPKEAQPLVVAQEDGAANDGGNDEEQQSGRMTITSFQKETSLVDQKKSTLNFPDRQRGMTGFSFLPTYQSDQSLSDPASKLLGAEAGEQNYKTSTAEWTQRQEAVKLAAKESWDVYEKYAMGDDELAPLTLTGKSSISFGGMAATLIDALDTLWLLGLREEFGRARNWIASNLYFDKRSKLSLFETIIRIAGGLISAYDLSGDRLFLNKSQQLVDKLMPCLNTTKTGIPTNLVQFNAAPGEYKKSEIGRAALAEFGTIQVEFLALSQRTSNATYGEKAESLIRAVHENYPDRGLLPVWFNRKQARFTGSQLYTVGAMADSFFEYLLKMWLLHQKQDEMYRSMWEKAIDEIIEQLLAINLKGVTVIGQRRNRGLFSAKLEALACYLPGNIALGVHEGAVEKSKGNYYLDVAANLTSTCYNLYNSTATGLGLDVVMFNDQGEMIPKVKKNMLRPETVESLFYMWRITGNQKYREWGWIIFQAFQKYSRTPEGAYATVKDVNVVPVEQEDTMESFWLAETLKYLWLMFGSDDVLPFSDWVLNTEAHPFRISLPMLQNSL